MSFFRGRWDEFIADADNFIAECELSPHTLESPARSLRAYVRLARGDHAGSLADWERSLAKAREVKGPQTLLPSLLQTAQGYALLGREDEARGFAFEALEVARAHLDLASSLTQITSVAKRLGIREDVRALLEQASPTAWTEAALAGAEGDFVRAADIFADRGLPALEAEARLSAAEELIESGRQAEGETELEKALTFYRSVGATFYIERGEALLAEAATG
jgi:tetratricopeptide (TPR) repeat protein